MARFKLAQRSGHFVDIEGLDELITDMESLGRKARVPLRQAMREAVKLVAAEAKRRLTTGDRTGREYPRPGSKRTYRASAPGEAPAKVLADLSKSIKVEVAKSGLSGRVLTRDPKGHLMEYGTVRLAPRPFLRPALAAVKGEVMKLLERGYRRGVAAVFGFRGRSR